MKTDTLHKYYKPKILNSPGIGKDYIETRAAKNNQYKEGETKAVYITGQGHKMPLPIYWRNKIYNEEEREKLWIEKLNENKRYIGGEEINADDEKGYQGLLKYYRKINNEMGYGSPEEYDAIEYEQQRRKLKQEERINAAKEKKHIGHMPTGAAKKNTQKRTNKN